MNQPSGPAPADEAGPVRHRPLRAWLDEIDAQRRSRDVPYLIGCTGHLLLSASEEAIISTALTEDVLPEILRLSRGRRLVLMCGLAPGTDLLFLRVASRWLASRRIEYGSVGLLPVPPAQLEADWSQRANLDGYTVSARDSAQILARIEAALGQCRTRVDLGPDLPADRMARGAVREQRYRWLGAVLATRADALVAVLRRDNPNRPGGTSETVLWRRDPASIPEALRRGVAGAVVPSNAALFVIDPQSRHLEPETASAGAGGWRPDVEDEAERIAHAARRALDDGNDLLCNDLVYRAFERGLSSPELAWLRVQSLANVGSSELALRQYEELAPPPEQREARWLTLLGRLHKDRAMQTGGEPAALVHAAQHYLAAYRRRPDAYPAINAATLLVLAGDLQQGRDWALQALHLLPDSDNDADAGTHAADPVGEYFSHATAAEACLILGRLEPARAALARADARLPADFWRRQVTLRQLRRLCRALDVDPSVLAGLRPPPLIVLRRKGDLRDAAPLAFELVADDLPAHATWFVSLADVFDLCVIEALLARGQAVHACLPYSANALVEYAHRQYGGDWGRRLERCLGRLRRVTVARGFLESERVWAAMETRGGTLGLARLAAHRGIGDCRQVDVVPQAGGAQLVEADPDAAPDAACPSAAGRRMVGLIFADIAGFMRLDDPDLPALWAGVMTRIGALLDGYGESVLLRQTWGDALHVVTTGALAAAEIAQAIQCLVAEQAGAAECGLARLELRVAVHYAPAFEGWDPIQCSRTYFGTQLTFTARIEPVTPPGQVYVTESLAMQLELEAPNRFACDYVGEIQLAKRFGDYRIYAMRPAQSWAN